MVRFWNSEGQDIIPRKDKIWTIGKLAQRMVKALEKSHKPIPPYLKGIALEYENPYLKTINFALYCFWTGEFKLGKIPGVVKTEAGFFKGKEVTQVWYDSRIIDLVSLTQQAAKLKCADKVFVNEASEEKLLSSKTRLSVGTFNPSTYRKAPQSDQKKQIQKNPIAKVPNLTNYQLTKINAFYPINIYKALSYLSPKQQNFFINN